MFKLRVADRFRSELVELYPRVSPRARHAEFATVLSPRPTYLGLLVTDRSLGRFEVLEAKTFDDGRPAADEAARRRPCCCQ